MNKGYAEPPTFDMSDRCASEPEPMPETFATARRQDASWAAFEARVNHIKTLAVAGLNAKQIAAVMNERSVHFVQQVMDMQRRAN